MDAITRYLQSTVTWTLLYADDVMIAKIKENSDTGARAVAEDVIGLGLHSVCRKRVGGVLASGYP